MKKQKYVEEEKKERSNTNKIGLTNRRKDVVIHKKSKKIIERNLKDKLSKIAKDELIHKQLTELDLKVSHSNNIYQQSKEEKCIAYYIGPIKQFLIGVILNYVDYKFFMTNIRYLNKSFLAFTQENYHYCQSMKRKAYIKVNLKEIYEGYCEAPNLCHPYYSNCTKLIIIYQICKINDIYCEKQEYNLMFIRDLFEKECLFPSLKTLKIIVSHSQSIHFNQEKLITPYKFIAESKHLQVLEKLIIKDSRLCVNWKSLQSMTPENFPNLKYLDVPINAIYDYVVSDDIPVNYFPGLHIKYSHCIDHSGLYNYKLADRYYHLYQGFKIFESSKLTMIGCDKLEFSYPQVDYCYCFYNFTDIDRFNYTERDPCGRLKSLKKWKFSSLEFTDEVFDCTRNIENILKINSYSSENKKTSERTNDDLNNYEIIDGYIDPLEEFVVPHCQFTDHSLYLLTHSPSFVNLKIVDFRGNNIKSLLLLKINYSKSQGAVLEELYVDTIVNEGESYNISFLFEAAYKRFSNLKVLWIEAKSNNLFVEFGEEELDSNKFTHDLTSKYNISYNFMKLFLGGIDFIGKCGQFIFDRLENCVELTLKKCKFEDLDHSNPLKYLNSLKILSIIETNTVIDFLHKCNNIHKSLNSLKLNSIRSPNIMNIIEMFENLNYLRIAKFKFIENKVKFDISQLPKPLRKFELIKCHVDISTIIDLCSHNFCNVSELVLLDNEFKKPKIIQSVQSSSTKITKLTLDDSLFMASLTSYKDLWAPFSRIFPNIEVLTYYKRKITSQTPSSTTVLQILPSLISSVNSGLVFPNFRHLKFICKCATIESYWNEASHFLNIRGLFSYTFDGNTTIESMLSQ